jgi:hypothetical protein
VDPTDAVAAAIASSHSCGACGRELPTEQLRDFAGVPVCVECYRDLGLLTLLSLEVPVETGLVGALLSCPPAEVPAGPRRRFEALEDFASRIDPAAAEQLVTSAARGQVTAGLQEVMWVLLAAGALLRSGGTQGRRPLDGRELSMLLHLAARVGLDVAWAAMVDTGVARRALNDRGDEWAYEDLITPSATGPQPLAAEKEAFARYIRAVKGKHDLLVRDALGRRDETDIPLEILKRSADEVLASIHMMERPGGASPKSATSGAPPPDDP